jgi:hypothetical protein
MKKLIKRYEVRTDHHDSCGEPMSRTIEGTEIKAWIQFIEISRACAGYSVFNMMRNEITRPDRAQTYLHLEDLMIAAFDAVQDGHKGTLSKWDFRTGSGWKIFEIENGKSSEYQY